MTRGGEAQTWRHWGFETVGDSWDLLQRKKQTTIGEEGLWNGWFFGSWIRGGSSYCMEFDLKNGIFWVGMWWSLPGEFQDEWVLRDHSSSQVPWFHCHRGGAHDWS